MDNLFLFIAVISSFALPIFIILAIVNYVKKDQLKGKKMLKNSGISFAIMFVSFIAFGVTTDSTETAKEKEKVETVAKTETPEEKAAREAKEAEEKAASEKKAKEEAEAKAKAEEEVRLKAEQEAKEKAKAEAQAAAAKKANAKTINYAQLKKNPDRYKGEYVKYTGEILQILEGDNITNIRLAVTKTSYGYDFNDVIYIEYKGYTDFVDNDIVTVYGEIYGSYSYESQAGYNITLPGLIADKVE